MHAWIMVDQYEKEKGLRAALMIKGNAPHRHPSVPVVAASLFCNRMKPMSYGCRIGTSVQSAAFN